MQMFRHKTSHVSERDRDLVALSELLHTIADFIAAIAFLVGSILFFWSALETIAIWFFVVGSVFFAAKPTIRLVTELRMLRRGDAAGPQDSRN